MRPRIALFAELDRSTAAVIPAIASVGDICAVVARTPARRMRQKVAARRWLAPDWSFAANLHRAAQRPMMIAGDQARMDASLISTLSDSRADLLISVLYPRKISSDVLNCFSLGALNIHPARLPEVAGPQPVYWLIANDAWREVGEVTLHVMDAGLDTGAILARATMAETAFSAPHAYKTGFAGAAAALIKTAVPDWLAGNLVAHPQQVPSDRVWASKVPEPIPVGDDWSIERLERAFAFLGKSPGLSVLVGDAPERLPGPPRAIGPKTGEAAKRTDRGLSFDLNERRILASPLGWLQSKHIQTRNRRTWSGGSAPEPESVQVIATRSAERSDQTRAAAAAGSVPSDRK